MRPLGSLRRTDAYRTTVCFAVAVVAEVGLRTVQLPRLAARLGVPLGVSHLPNHPPEVLPRWTRPWLEATDRVISRWPVGPDGKCLRRALVAGNRMRTLEPRLVMGVRRQEATVAAHAWVVVAGGSLDPTAGAWQQLPYADAGPGDQ